MCFLNMCVFNIYENSIKSILYREELSIYTITSEYWLATHMPCGVQVTPPPGKVKIKTLPILTLQSEYSLFLLYLILDFSCTSNKKLNVYLIY